MEAPSGQINHREPIVVSGITNAPSVVHTTVNRLKITFANVDVLTGDKLNELKSRIKEAEFIPHIVALQEVNPKYYRYERVSAEYEIEGYEIIAKNLSSNDYRGLLVYIIKGVKYRLVPIKSSYNEFICMEILGKHESFLFVSIYRSPSSDRGNDMKLLELFQEISDLSFKYKIIVGDFNLPQIDWTRHLSLRGVEDINTMFLEKVRDCYLTQHIEDITRIRGGDRGSTLDLIFSNDETIIEDISVNSPLGKSDHGYISFFCDVEDLQETSKKKVYMYEKADYHKMRQKLNIDWRKLLEAEADIEGKWTKFKNEILGVVEECIPKRTFMEGCTKRRLNKNLPMNKKLWSKIKEKAKIMGTNEQIKEF